MIYTTDSDGSFAEINATEYAVKVAHSGDTKGWLQERGFDFILAPTPTVFDDVEHAEKAREALLEKYRDLGIVTAVAGVMHRTVTTTRSEWE